MDALAILYFILLTGAISPNGAGWVTVAYVFLHPRHAVQDYAVITSFSRWKNRDTRRETQAEPGSPSWCHGFCQREK